MQLHPSAVFYFALRRMGTMLVPGLLIGCFVAIAVTVSQKSPPILPKSVQAALIILGFGFLGFLLALSYAYLVVRAYRISLEKDGILLQHGLININNEILLYNKIQDVVVTRNLLERTLSLATLTIQNAMGQPEVIPGLGAADAEAFRNDILGRIRR
jgi:membrane protein YdbS with pleckstrin-like domain